MGSTVLVTDAGGTLKLRESLLTDGSKVYNIEVWDGPKCLWQLDCVSAEDAFARWSHISAAFGLFTPPTFIRVEN